MQEKSPQKIGGELEVRIFAICEAQLECLIQPRVKRAIAADIEELDKELVKDFEDGQTRACLRAGLWLLADDLDQAHRICQEVPTIYGSAWHAVVHRREGDFWNSKYWWRRTGGVKWEGLEEEIKRALAGGPAELKSCVHQGRYDPARFVDLVEEHHEGGSMEMRAGLVKVQRLEWKALFAETIDRAGR